MKGSTKSSKNKLRTKKKRSLGLPQSYPWKVLGKLSQDLKEYLSVDEFNRLDRITRDRDLDEYLKLNEEWGLQSTLPTDITCAVMRAKYLLASLIKKFPFKTDKNKRVARALEIFFEAEEACKLYNQTGYEELASPTTEWGVNILRHAKLFLVKLLGDRLPGHREMLERSRHGPGATICTYEGQSSVYYKYANWPYSCTVGALRYARFAIAIDQRWIGALQDSYRQRFGILKHMPINEEEFWSKVIHIAPGNRITTVPKDALKERTIAIEPLLNVYLQLGADGYIRRRLKRYGVDLDAQEKNQELARLGSMRDDENSFVTVDLSSASDSISLKLIEVLLPKEWYTYLMDLRSPTGNLEGSPLTFEKVSSMGNGYTFALESAIFTALVYAVIKTGGGTFDHSKFAVFGDDIVVERRWYYQLVEALRLSGFKLNLEKTFVYGPIRESCGTDWFNGKAIRPLFLDKIPTMGMEVLCDYNRIKRLLSLRWMIEESDTLDFIWKWIPDKHKLLVGPFSDEEFDSYVHVPTAPPGLYRNGIYKYYRLHQYPIAQAGKNFLMRKLMHSLRGKPIKSPKWDKRLQASGSVFTVTSRKALAVGITYSRTSYWCDKYTEYLPPAVFSRR